VIWRRRLLLAAGLVLSIAVFIGLGGTTPVVSSTAVAWTRVVLDTPKTQLVAANPVGADSLAWRASLLAHLLGTQASTNAIAQRLGVPGYQVQFADPTLATPQVQTLAAVAATQEGSLTFAPYVLSASEPNDSLPLISIEAVALNRAAAINLANAAVAQLQSQASRGGSFRSRVVTGGTGLWIQPFVVTPVAPVREAPITTSSLSTKAVGGAVFLFVAWCLAIFLGPRIGRRMRGRRAVLAA
jgi:hypothetical protein